MNGTCKPSTVQDAVNSHDNHEICYHTHVWVVKKSMNHKYYKVTQSKPSTVQDAANSNSHDNHVIMLTTHCADSEELAIICPIQAMKCT